MKMSNAPEYCLVKNGSWAGRPAVILSLTGSAPSSDAPAVIIEAVLSQSTNDCKRLVIQSDTDPLREQQDLLLFLRELSKVHHYETLVRVTGGVMPDYLLREFVDQWDVTLPPEEPSWGWNPDALIGFTQVTKATFEWVVWSQGDIDTAGRMAHEAGIPHSRVLLTPRVSVRAKNWHVNQYAERAALQTGCNVGHPIIEDVPSLSELRKS